MNYNITEKKAIYRILELIMKSDGFILDPELEYLTEVGKSLELTFEDICSTDEYDFTYCHTVVTSMDEAKKQSVKKLFYEMAYADKVLVQEEQALIDDIFS